jgi:hypothetical protein
MKKLRQGVTVMVVVVAWAVVGLGATAGAADAPVAVPAAATGPPIGAFDAVSVRFDDNAVLSGWAADPDRPPREDGPRALDVALYVGGTLIGTVPTGSERPDVAQAVPWAGPWTGWQIALADLPLSASRPPGTTVCAYARNPGGGGKVLLGCRDFRVAPVSAFSPVGALELAGTDPGRVQLRGWAADPDGDATTRIAVDVDGSPVLETTASQPRPDVAAALGLGATSGFNLTLPAMPGGHVICVRAQNTGTHGAGNATIGCAARTIPGVQPPGPHDPRGNLDALDAVAVDQNGVFRWVSKGWAYDPDSSGPVNVRVRTLGSAPSYRFPNRYPYYDSVYATGVARPDVADAIPDAGPSSGFDGSHVTLRNPEIRLMCAYAINAGAGSNQLIGCIQPRHL